MPAVLTQLVYLKYRAGTPPVSVSFIPSYRARIDSENIFRSRADVMTTHRARVDSETIHRGRLDVP